MTGATGTGGNSNVVFTKIHDFNVNDFARGNNPNGRLIIDAVGNLFGVTLYGGYDPGNDPLGGGVMFALKPVSGGAYQYRVMHVFKGGPGDGARPVGGLTMDAAGNLYGTTSAGGSGWTGIVFKLAVEIDADVGAGLTTLYEFTAVSQPAGTNSDGAAPTSSLLVGPNGTLYGTTSNGGANGGGTVFSLTPQPGGSYTFAKLHDFAAPQGYGDTTGGLTMDAAGNLYGLKAAGGAYASGEIFGLFLSGQTYSYHSLYSFPQVDYTRALPMGNLVIDAAGQLFGTTNEGGNNLSGTVFSFPSGAQAVTPTRLYTFNDLSGPFAPDAGVIVDSAGNLYGTASYSASGNGAVYKLTPNGDGTYAYATLFEFTEMKRQGNAPENTLVADPVGHLFGTTVEGGTYDSGVVFRLGETAEAIAVMEAGVVLQVTVTKPGFGYATAPAVTITPPANGMTAQAVATVVNGSVTAVTVTSQGSGYDFGPQVGFTPPGGGGGQPAQAAARVRYQSRSRALRVRSAARRYSARASAGRPSRLRKSARAAGSGA